MFFAVGAYFNILARLVPTTAAKKGFNLLCYPFRSKIHPKHRSFFETATQETIVSGRDKVTSYRWGNGDVKILFLHGWQSHSYLWKTYIETLDKSRYTLYAFDAPGHGLSPGNFLTMPHYSTVIQHVIEKIGKVDYVVAHSLASFSMLHACYTNQKIAPSNLILLSSPGSVQEFFDFFQTRLKLTQRCIDLVTYEFEKLMSSPVSSFVAERYAMALKTRGILIHDELDPEISVEHSYSIHKRWRNSVLITTKGKGHNLRSQDVVDLVLRYIETGQVEKG